ncbi:type II 3-dehydroquinate dehydratase [bacterium]|nr:type II 3-dehydroquinate dehydratase [bacterium]
MIETKSGKKAVLVIHGPNLAKLGQREPDLYGSTNLDDINRQLEEMALLSGWSFEAVQSNHEGKLIDVLETADQNFNAVIINPGGLTHTSVSLRDAIKACPLPVIEVHITNIHSRENFRQQSIIAPVCRGSVSGFGYHSYLMALWFFISTIE